jgi:hypothetical protein
MLERTPHAVPWIKINGAITAAYCSECGDELPMGDKVGSPEEQQAKLDQAFARLFQTMHPERM